MEANAKLFKLIYKQKEMPEQWKVSKTIPIHVTEAVSDF